MAHTMYGCGLPEDHDPHWVREPPAGVLGGAFCAGNAIAPPDMSRWLPDGGTIG